MRIVICVFAAQRINVFAQLGGNPSFMLSPPKEELVEKVSDTFFAVVFCLNALVDLSRLRVISMYGSLHVNKGTC